MPRTRYDQFAFSFSFAPLVLVLTIVAVALVEAQEPAPPAPPSAISEAMASAMEVHQLRVEVARLKFELAKTVAKSDECTLSVERRDLERGFREAMKPAAGTVFDWKLGQFVAPKK